MNMDFVNSIKIHIHSQKPEMVTITLVGDHTDRSIDMMSEYFNGTINNFQYKQIIDFSHVISLGHLALETIYRHQKHLLAQGGGMVICKAPASIKEFFDLSLDDPDCFTWVKEDLEAEVILDGKKSYKGSSDGTKRLYKRERVMTSKHIVLVDRQNIKYEMLHYDTSIRGLGAVYCGCYPPDVGETFKVLSGELQKKKCQLEVQHVTHVGEANAKGDGLHRIGFKFLDRI